MEENVKEFGKGIIFPRDLQKHEDLLTTKPGLEVLAIVGMAGIGKTTLANEIFQHFKSRGSYKYYAWVTVGPNYDLAQIRRSILQQKNPRVDAKATPSNDLPFQSVNVSFPRPLQPYPTFERTMTHKIHKILKKKKYLVVLDDVWDLELLNGLDFSVAVVLTTRLHEVARMSFLNYDENRRRLNAALGGCRFNVVQMPFLNKEESWDLLRRKVFHEMPCPRELDKDGKKIAEKCDGLPLTIVTVAAILSRDDQPKTPEHWNMVAERKRDPVFMEAYEQIYEVLYPSYKNLPVCLDECFLYMGVFPLKHEIRTSKLIKLWSVEDILKWHPSKTSAQVALKFLKDLHLRSLVLKLEESSNGGIKTCRLHSVFWYLCYRLGREEKIFLALDSVMDCSVENIEQQHRLSFYNNALFGIKDLRSLINPDFPIRSLLSFGPYHQYEVPIWSHLSNLKVIDALSIRFYDFPIEVVELDQLRVSTDFLPMEVWDMKELKHLQVTGSNLPDPDSQDKLLPNLLTLLDVGARCCTKSIFERIPNLEKLGILIELPPDGSETPCFGNHISHLEKLTSLKCVVVNPTLIAPPPFPDLPSGLKKLSLSGFGYPWEEMSKIAELEHLEVLKLRCYAFQGPKWDSTLHYNYGEAFPQLNYFLIEDTDLVEWIDIGGWTSFRGRIIIRNCYRFKCIDTMLWCFAWFELVDCPLLGHDDYCRPYYRVHRENIYRTNSWEK